MTSDVVTLAAELVRMDSSAARGAIEALRDVDDWFAASGVGRRTWKQAESHAALLVLPQEKCDNLLLFSAHIDVVPPGSSWSRDPFSGDIVDRRLHGRGASDMKAGLAAAMLAVRDGLQLGAPVGLIVTTSEETGCQGAELAEDELRALSIGGVIIPEATGNVVALGHRGALWLSVCTSGRAAHGSVPHHGSSAISGMTAVLTRLADLPLRTSKLLGEESVNVGTIVGGTAVNMVPDECTIGVDHRTIGPAEPILAWWRAQPEVSEVRVVLDLPSVQTAADSELVTLLSDLTDVAAEAVSYFTDASVLTKCCGGAPMVVWGPGDPNLVHGADETVETDAVETALHSYRELVSRWSMRVATGQEVVT